MPQYFANAVLTLGLTPMVRLNRVIDGSSARVLAKLEGRNPSHSVKSRAAASMVWDAETAGLLGPGQEILEVSAGNTGIALACVDAARKIPVTIIAPDTVVQEKRQLLAAFGAKLILTDGALGLQGALAKAETLAREDEHYVYLRQFSNPANAAIHEQTTGPEIWTDTGGQIDALVCGVGTGGTITGISRYIKRSCGKAIHSTAVEPSSSAVLTQTRRGEPLHAVPHKIEGIGAGFVPEGLDLSLIDEVMKVSEAEAAWFTRRMIREEGLLVGISGGAAVAAAARLVQQPEWANKTVVLILPDSGLPQLESALVETLPMPEKH